MRVEVRHLFRAKEFPDFAKFYENEKNLKKQKLFQMRNHNLIKVPPDFLQKSQNQNQDKFGFLRGIYS